MKTFHFSITPIIKTLCTSLTFLMITVLISSCGDDPDPCEDYEISVQRNDDNVITITAEGTPYTYSIAYEGIETPQEGTSQETTITVEADEFAAATITVTNNCTASATAAAVNPCTNTDLALTMDRTVGDGGVDNLGFNITGGQAPYIYSITYTGNDTPQTGEAAEAGEFTVVATETTAATVTVTDDLGCLVNEGLVASACDGFEVAVERDIEDDLNFTITGGTAPYDYSIAYDGSTQAQEGESSEATFSVDAAQTSEATITITDASGCIIEIEVGQYPCLGFAVSAEGLDGVISLEITAGTAPYAYSIAYDGVDTPQTGESSDTELDIAVVHYNVAATVTVTDAIGCVTETVEVSAEDINSFVDNRDGVENRYGFKEYNGVVWMTENYRGQYTGYECPDGDADNCVTYGGLYTWAMATANDFAPNGWRLPTKAEAESLLESLEGDVQADYTALIEGGTTGLDFQLAGRYVTGAGYLRFSESGYYFLSDIDPDSDGFAHSIFFVSQQALVAPDVMAHYNSVRLVKITD